MTWKEAFKIAIAVAIVLIGVSFIFSGIVYWLVGRSFQERYKELGEIRMDIPRVMIMDVSCVTNSHYIVNLFNSSTKTVYLEDLNFYIDKSRVTWEGITSIEPGASATCKILQFATKGSHSLNYIWTGFRLG